MTTFALCAHLGYLFTELPFRARFKAAADAGFRFVEHPAPYEIPAEAFASLCTEHKLEVVQIALPAGRPGEKGLAALIGRKEEFRASVTEGIAYAREIGCGLIHPMAGVPADDCETSQVWELYRSNIAFACDQACEAGLDVIIEPIGAGTLAGYFMNHPAKALKALETVGRENLYLAFDAFHAAQNGVNPAAFARDHGARFRHVQIADDPGRHEPGTGAIDFEAFFEALDQVRYRGVIGLEYRPAADTISGLAWANRYARIIPLQAAVEHKEPAS
jgi:hydroxypyruvate isomerase